MLSGESGDSELIDGLRKRDPDALAAAYDRYGRLVYSVCLRIVRDQTAAEDLVQELFMRLWNRAKDFDTSKGALGVWLLSVARNIAIDHVRSAHARFQTRLRPIEHIREMCFSENAQIESIVDRAAILDSAFSGLTLNEKRVIELAYFEGLSQSEIANRLQEPVGTVKSWTRSAFKRLRAAIKGDAET